MNSGPPLLRERAGVRGSRRGLANASCLPILVPLFSVFNFGSKNMLDRVPTAMLSLVARAPRTVLVGTKWRSKTPILSLSCRKRSAIGYRLQRWW